MSRKIDCKYSWRGRSEADNRKYLTTGFSSLIFECSRGNLETNSETLVKLVDFKKNI